MIRINLLGAPKQKKGKRSGFTMPSVSAEGRGLLIIGLVFALLAAAGNGVYYVKLNRDAEQLQKDMVVANADYARLTQVKVRYQELEKQKDAYKRRVDVIDDLQTRQSGPVRLLSMVGQTINRTDEVWLNSMTDDGNVVNVKGVALSIHGVADLMRNLKNSGYFKNVEIKSSYQDEAVKDMQAFVFELSCEKQTQNTAGGPSQPKS